MVDDAAGRPAPAWAQAIAAERPHGTFTRQLFLGDALDAERLEATYATGVLTLHIPVAEVAKPRKCRSPLATTCGRSKLSPTPAKAPID